MACRLFDAKPLAIADSLTITDENKFVINQIWRILV